MESRWKLSRWALLTAALYFLTLVVLTYPAAVAAFFGEHGPDFDDVLRDVFGHVPYWVVIGALAIFEALFLLARVQVRRSRRVPQRDWTSLACVAGLMMGLLLFGLALALLEIVFRDPLPEHAWQFGTALAAGVAGWIFWAVLFARYARARPESAVRRVVNRLLQGSIAELLIAVPCHVYACQQTYCCAGVSTFVGLASGLAVLLFAFGPGVLFLFAARMRRLRKAQDEAATSAPPAPPPALARAGWSPDAKDALIFGGAAAVFLAVLYLDLWRVSDWRSVYTVNCLGYSSALTFGLAAWFHAGRGCWREQFGAVAAATILTLATEIAVLYTLAVW